MGREIQPRELRGTGGGGGLYPTRSMSASPPHCLLGSLCPWASPPSWWVSTACPSPHAPTSPRLMDEVGRGSSGTPTRSPASSPPSPAQADAAGEAEAEDAEGTEQAVYVSPSVPQFFQAPLPSSLALGRSGNARRSAASAPWASGGRHSGAQSTASTRKWGLLWVPLSHRDPPSPQSRRIRRPLRRR